MLKITSRFAAEMKHIVTISLVFFSLTHLAKAERIEGLKLITEFHNQQQVDSKLAVSTTSQLNEHRNPFLLSYSALSLIGILPEQQAPSYITFNHIVADLTIRKKPKNNSP